MRLLDLTSQYNVVENRYLNTSLLVQQALDVPVK